MTYYIHTLDNLERKREFFVCAEDNKKAIQMVCMELSFPGYIQTGIVGGCYKVINFKKSKGILFLI